MTLKRPRLSLGVNGLLALRGYNRGVSRCLAALAFVVIAAGCSGDSRPAPAPPAGTIVATHFFSGLVLNRIDARTGRVVRLSPGRNGTARDSQPTFSPDGRRVAFVRETLHGAELRLLELRSGRRRDWLREHGPELLAFRASA